jgi:hypothetical protein
MGVVVKRTRIEGEELFASGRSGPNAPSLYP